jgi:hypothetical protein
VDGERILKSLLARYGDAVMPLPNTTRVLRVKPTKTKRFRRIPLPADLIGKLHQHFVAQGRLREELGMGAIDLNEWMFPRPDAPGQLWAPSAFTSCYRALLRRRGIKSGKFHGLRHAYGSQFIQDGFDVKTVPTLMGHSRPSTTLNVYAHLLEEPDQEVALSIQARIDKPKTRPRRLTALGLLINRKPLTRHRPLSGRHGLGAHVAILTKFLPILGYEQDADFLRSAAFP